MILHPKTTEVCVEQIPKEKCHFLFINANWCLRLFFSNIFINSFIFICTFPAISTRARPPPPPQPEPAPPPPAPQPAQPTQAQTQLQLQNGNITFLFVLLITHNLCIYLFWILFFELMELFLFSTHWQNTWSVRVFFSENVNQHVINISFYLMLH